MPTTPPPQRPAPARSSRATWSLIALSLIPASAGALGGPLSQSGLPWLGSSFVPPYNALGPELASVPVPAAEAPAAAVDVRAAVPTPAAPAAAAAAVAAVSSPASVAGATSPAPSGTAAALAAAPAPPARAALPALGFDPDSGIPSTPFGELIYRVASRHQVNPHLVAAVVRAESGFRPRAVSRKGACGLMQLLPATARRFGVGKRELFDPIKNLDAGVRYLRWLADRFAGNAELVLAAYNAGEGAVELFGGVPPYRETQEYLRRILGRFEAGEEGGGTAAAPVR